MLTAWVSELVKTHGAKPPQVSQLSFGRRVLACLREGQCSVWGTTLEVDESAVSRLTTREFPLTQRTTVNLKFAYSPAPAKYRRTLSPD